MMKTKFLLFALCITLVSFSKNERKTIVSISENQFLINGELTYKGRNWEGHKIEGLLFNSRMVQGVFDDLNPETRDRFAYPDTKVWDADRNTNEFISNMEEWRSNGLLSFTLNLQGGSPMGYGNEGWINSAFDEKGELRSDYMRRLERLLDKADELNMVVILGYFYFGQDQYLENEQAVINSVDNITNWILNKGYKNILIEINNECNIRYDHEILQPNRVHELISRVQNTKKDGYNLLVSTSYTGGHIPESSVVKEADFILLHGNGVEDPDRITKMVERTRQVEGYTSMPIVFNEDDHFDFEADNNNMVAAVKAYASWGFFDYRMKDEGFESGYQSVPVDWGINSERKKAFFKKLKEITSDSMVTDAQQTELIGTWQLSKVVTEDKTYENLAAIYIFEKGGVLKAARSSQSEVIEAGNWKFNKKQQAIVMSSALDKDFNGTATLVKISDTELIYKKDNAVLHFQRLSATHVVSGVESEKNENTIARLAFTEADFFNENGDYKHYDDEAKLPWQDIDEMLMGLVNVKQLVYKFSTLDEEAMVFEDKILSANVNSNPSEQSLSIDFVFYGYDRYNLPEDTELPPNTEYSNLLFPEEDNPFRVSGSEQITTMAGTFDCTVVEVVGSFETCKKLWMINDKPGVYAKIIADKPGTFGQYSVYELQEIRVLE